MIRKGSGLRSQQEHLGVSNIYSICKISFKYSLPADLWRHFHCSSEATSDPLQNKWLSTFRCIKCLCDIYFIFLTVLNTVLLVLNLQRPWAPSFHLKHLSIPLKSMAKHWIMETGTSQPCTDGLTPRGKGHSLDKSGLHLVKSLLPRGTALTVNKEAIHKHKNVQG